VIVNPGRVRPSRHRFGNIPGHASVSLALGSDRRSLGRRDAGVPREEPAVYILLIILLIILL
jgi:hypothetical protein